MESEAKQTCTARLDRFTFTAIGPPEVPRKIGEFEISRDIRPRVRGKIGTYERVRTFHSTSNSARLSVQYKPLLPWLRPLRFTLIADDDDGITPDQVEGVIAQCAGHKLTMAELAFDFAEGSVVDRRFVLQHARFGKTQRRSDRGGPGNLRYGSRKSPKMARAYFKETLGCFRVELEIHSGLLRKFGISSGFELGRVAAGLVPAHVEFVAFRWGKLRAYLVKKFGHQDGGQVLDEARERAESSLGNATRYLSRRGVPNVHRFLGPLRVNRDVRAAIRCWARAFSTFEELAVEVK